MAAKIPVQIHIGVVSLPLPAGRVYSETRVTITETGSGMVHSASLDADQVPIPDEAGNPHFVVSFPAVQSGESLHIDVRCLDPNEVLIGSPATHEVTLDEVPDNPPPGQYPQPSSIFLTT